MSHFENIGGFIESGSAGMSWRVLENETRRLIGWLPGEQGGRAVGRDKKGGAQRAPQREKEIVVVARWSGC